ncbi:MAG: chlorophyll synthase ChlG [Pseudomonadota bacterium]
MAVRTKSRTIPDPATVLELFKPVTWFPPMWAYLCGIVSVGVPVAGRWDLAVLGILLAGPLVCAMSQAVNDWCDRHVDAINEPDRPIPSGRMPERWGFGIALAWTGLSLAVGSMLGPWGFGATVFAVICAWAYSAEPLRLKRNGWWSNTVCGLCYEGVPWFTAAAVMSAAMPDPRIISVALLYALGAHGIMTLNDFKALDGDRQMGLGSLPVKLGPRRAARLACWTMALPQVVVVVLLLLWDQPWHALAISAVLAVQALFMRRLLTNPRKLAPWYNTTGIVLYVSGMMIAAFALRSAGGGI